MNTDKTRKRHTVYFCNVTDMKHLRGLQGVQCWPSVGMLRVTVVPGRPGPACHTPPSPTAPQPGCWGHTQSRGTGTHRAHTEPGLGVLWMDNFSRPATERGVGLKWVNETLEGKSSLQKSSSRCWGSQHWVETSHWCHPSTLRLNRCSTASSGSGLHSELKADLTAQWGPVPKQNKTKWLQ